MSPTIAVPLLVLLFATAAFPWLLVFRFHLGHLLAVPATGTGALLALLALMAVSHVLNTPYMVSLILGSALIGVAGLVLCLRTRGIFRRPGRYAIALWCPALLGAILWIGLGLAAQVLPNASQFGWAMNGDALNNLYFASNIADSNGISIVSAANSVPLPAILIAIGLGAGVPSSATGSAALVHELTAITEVWIILLALFCVMIGAVTASLIPVTRTRVIILASALGSLLPLTWFGAGLTIQWGYFNVDVILPVLLAAWLTYLGSKSHPFAALLCLIGEATVALAAWTPMAILVVGLGIALVVRHRREFFRIRRSTLIPLLIVVGVGLVFFLIVTVPAFAGQAYIFDASGAGFAGFPNLWWSVPLVAALLVLAMLVVRRRTGAPVTSGAIALIASGGAASVLLVALASPDGQLFTAYYPKKFAWIFILLIAAITLSFLLGAIAAVVRLSVTALALVAALIAAVVLPPGTWPETLQRQPIARILGDYVRHRGESTVREIVKLSSNSHSTMLWRSGDPDEPIVNEWLILAHGGLADGNRKLISVIGQAYFLYRTSGRYTDSSILTVCHVLPHLKGRPVVVTADPGAARELQKACPSLPVTLAVTDSLVGPLPAKTGEDWITDGIEGPTQ